jgi:two-component system, LytTR family, response regulator LytT
MKKSFEVQPFRYLLKPVDEEDFRRTSLQAAEELMHNRSVLSFTLKNTAYHVRMDEILYITVESGKKLVILTPDASYSYYGRLGDLEKQLAPYGFCRIHTGYIVNWRHVRSVGKTEVVLKNKVQLPVSRSKRGQVVPEYHAYIEKRLLR